ncbi:hypothetical protein B2G71_14185 [Novosphingobium sp. PC22D]|uniref:hypothetical protein n=1 Tax=Novosphingobium sp. PC22D TaxID=1962403 RepID=UPI000BEF8CB4|nr:hypothetical protein [Novosphingobium sp. PC22D]PEQ11930.1 hypothetical protein B2G71_14185 [Novosphingobium sp. PC22D]
MAFMEGFSSTGANERVREPRQRTLIRAKMSGERLHETEILVRNVSHFGICATSRGSAPERGETVTIDLPSGETYVGDVRWVDGLNFGVMLKQELNVRQLGVTTQRRNEKLSQSIDWLVDQRFEIKPVVDKSKLRPV